MLMAVPVPLQGRFPCIASSNFTVLISQMLIIDEIISLYIAKNSGRQPERDCVSIWPS